LFFEKENSIFKNRPSCCGAEKGAAGRRGKTAITELLKPCLRERRAYHVTAQAVCNSLAAEVCVF